jgi:hypothetical protein
MLLLNPEGPGFQQSCWAVGNQPCGRALPTTEPHQNTSRPSSPSCRVFGAVFQRDLNKIEIATWGADYAHVFNTANSCKFDFLLWGALQSGSRGRTHSCRTFLAIIGSGFVRLSTTVQCLCGDS